MKQKHKLVGDTAAFEADIRQALAEADDPAVKKIPHAQVMAEVDAIITAAELRQRAGNE